MRAYEKQIMKLLPVALQTNEKHLCFGEGVQAHHVALQLFGKTVEQPKFVRNGKKKD